MKVADLEGALLDYWVARAEGKEVRFCIDGSYAIVNNAPYSPSTNWVFCGLIIERELIGLIPILRDGETHWSGCAMLRDGIRVDGPTPQIAAMRAYVASKFGDEVPAVATNQRGGD